MSIHPLHQFIFCPSCGEKTFLEKNTKAKQCSSCGFTYYFNPSGAVACFIRNKKQELLVVQRANKPAKGTFDLPGGFIDMYESAEEAVHREIKEETGLEIGEVRYLFSLPNIYRYAGFDVHTIDLFFECISEDINRAKAADDAASIKILPIKELNSKEFGLSSIKQAIDLYQHKY